MSFALVDFITRRVASCPENGKFTLGPSIEIQLLKGGRAVLLDHESRRSILCNTLFPVSGDGLRHAVVETHAPVVLIHGRFEDLSQMFPMLCLSIPSLIRSINVLWPVWPIVLIKRILTSIPALLFLAALIFAAQATFENHHAVAHAPDAPPDRMLSELRSQLLRTSLSLFDAAHISEPLSLPNQATTSTVDVDAVPSSTDSRKPRVPSSPIERSRVPERAATANARASAPKREKTCLKPEGVQESELSKFTFDSVTARNDKKSKEGPCSAAFN